MVTAIVSPEFPGSPLEVGHTEIVKGSCDAQGSAILWFRSPGSINVAAVDKSRYGSAVLDIGVIGDYKLVVPIAPHSALDGMVLDEGNGSPIPGARVSCYASEALGEPAILSDKQGHFTIGPWPLNCVAGVTARAEGYGLELVKLAINSDGTWEIPARFGASASSGTGKPFVSIGLSPEQRITGLVADAQGNAVKGARIAARGLFLVAANTAREDSGTATSSDDGSFSIQGLRSDIRHAVIIEAASYASVVKVAIGHETLVNLGTIRLGTPVVVEGVVVDRDGRPVAGPEIAFFCVADPELEPALDPLGGNNRERDAWSKHLVVFEKRVFAQDSGRFRIEGMPQASLSMSVHLAGLPKLKREVQLSGGYQELEPCVIDNPGPDLVGKVQDSEMSNSATVEIAELGGAVLSSVRVDQAGSFRASGLQHGFQYVARLLRDGQRATNGVTRRLLFVFDGTTITL
jgi:hypothetical protein